MVCPAEIRAGQVWEAGGCNSCSGTGYLGRVGIFELLPVTSEICKIIVQRADAGTIRSLAVQQGMRLLRDDGWDKVRHGSRQCGSAQSDKGRGYNGFIRQVSCRSIFLTQNRLK